MLFRFAVEKLWGIYEFSRLNSASFCKVINKFLIKFLLYLPPNRTRQARRQIDAHQVGVGQGVDAVAAQVRLERRRKVCDACNSSRAQHVNRWSLHVQWQVSWMWRRSKLSATNFQPFSLLPFQRPPSNDEGSIRQLCRAEDDWRIGADAAQDFVAQDPAAHELAAQIHLRETHHRQVGKVLVEVRRQRINRGSLEPINCHRNLDNWNCHRRCRLRRHSG